MENKDQSSLPKQPGEKPVSGEGKTPSGEALLPPKLPQVAVVEGEGIKVGSEEEQLKIKNENNERNEENEKNEEVESEDELIVEEEEDFFWVVQRVVWGIVKTVFILGLIGFFVWIIWGPDKKSFSELEKAKSVVLEVSKEKGVSIQKEKLLPRKYISPADRLIELEEMFDPANQKSSIISSVLWLEKAGAFLNKSAFELIPSSVPQIRKQRVEFVLKEIRQLIEYSEVIQGRVMQEINAFSQRSKQANEDSVLNETAFFEALRHFEGVEAEIFLAQKVDAEKLVMANSTFASGRKILLQNIQRYDKRLRSLYENVEANKEALIHDVRVVDFPESTLEIILSPREWREGQ